MGIWNSLKSFFGFETVTVRAKDSKGKFVADDKSTPDVNEAYVTKTVRKKLHLKRHQLKEADLKKLNRSVKGDLFCLVFY